MNDDIPPKKDTRFPKGKSGNPSGRPKGSRSLPSLLANELRKKILVVIGGKQVHKSKAELITRRLVDSAINGDVSKIALIAKLLQAKPGDTAQDQAPVIELGQDALKRVLLRMAQHVEGDL